MAETLELTLHLFAVTQITVFIYPDWTITILLRCYAVTGTPVLISFPLHEPSVHFLNFQLAVFLFPNLLIGPKVSIFEFHHLIGYQWPNAARRIVTCMNTKQKKQSVLAVSLNVDSGLLSILPLQDLRGIKLSQLRNSHYVKKSEQNTFISTLTSCDNCWTLLTPRNAQRLFLSTHPFLVLPILCLTRGHSILLAQYILFQHMCTGYKVKCCNHSTDVQYFPVMILKNFPSLAVQHLCAVVTMSEEGAGIINPSTTRLHHWSS
jgi:hypothetical protein